MEIIFFDLKPQTIICSESKESFNFIKGNLVKKLKPFRVAWSTSKQKIILIENITFKNAILYLSVKDELHQGSDTNLDKIKRLVSNIKDKKNFFSLFFDKSLHLECLSNKQSIDYLIIPTEEKIKKGSSYIVEDSFIFTINTPISICILWENTNKERATYIFNTSTDEYSNDLQIVFDYIVSASTNKRKMLYLKQSKELILNSCKILYHSDYRTWVNKIETLLI